MVHESVTIHKMDKLLLAAIRDNPDRDAARSSAMIAHGQSLDMVEGGQPRIADKGSSQQCGKRALSAYETYRKECWKLIRDKQAMWWHEVPGETKSDRLRRFNETTQTRFDEEVTSRKKGALCHRCVSPMPSQASCRGEALVPV